MNITPNMEEAKRFLNALGCSQNNTRLRTFDDKKKGGVFPACYPSSDFDKLAGENKKGAGVFVVVNETTGDTDKDVIGVRSLFADLDGIPLEPVLELLLAAGLMPHIIVESSPGRYHVYLKVSDCTLDQFTPLQKAIAAKLGSDKTVVNNSRVMRLPGFIHQKKDPFLTRVMDISDHDDYTVQQVINALALKIGKQTEPHDNNATSNDDPFQGSSEGGRTKCIERAAGVLFKQGYSVGDAIGFCETLDLTKNRPTLAETNPGKVKETVEGIYKRYFSDDEWPLPHPLPEGLPPVKQLDPAMIPLPFRGWLSDIAHRMQSAIDYCACAAIVAAGSVVGRSCGIYPKKHDNWLVVPNLYGGCVGDPSVMKTPSMAEGTKPLVRLEIESQRDFEDNTESADVAKEILKIKRAALSESLKALVKKDPSADVSELSAEMEKLQDCALTRRRYVTQDGTTEKIGELLNENPNGMLIQRDELIGWFYSLNKPGREADRGFYLEAWNGTGRFTYDRISRGTLDIDALCISIFGAITPGPLADYIRATIKGGVGDDGMLQRFQVMVYPDHKTDWVNIDRYPDTEQKNRAFEIFRRLAFDVSGAVQEDEDSIPALRFSPAGQDIFDQWRHELESRLRGDHGLHPAMLSHLAKYRSLMPSLALIFHLVGVADGTTAAGPVTEDAAIMAAAWCDYLESHAGRIYGSATSYGLEAAKEIVKHIRRGEIKDGCKPKDIYRRQWSRLATPEDVKAGLDVLIENDWLIVKKQDTGGRPSEIIHLNPNIKLG